jgi:putative mRNA 3-end processing factor
MIDPRKILRLTEYGLYCSAGDFFIDPWRPTRCAIITHGHSDHARSGSSRYLSHRSGEAILRSRLGSDIEFDPVEYGEKRKFGDAWVSLHPAGHILGSSQVRVEVGGATAVVTGDYKRQADSTCEPFEVVECDLLITESTFGLPVFRWPKTEMVMAEIHRWWRSNQKAGKASVLLAYALGKSQRLLSGLDASIGPIILHGAVKGPTMIYRDQGYSLPEFTTVHDLPNKTDWSQSLVLAVPGAQGTPWLRRFGDVSIAMASGWMAVRGTRRRRSVDRGFVISDHVDWPDLLQTIEQSKARIVWVTHGFSEIVARYLTELGLEAEPLSTQFRGESGEEELASEVEADA